MVNYPVNQYLAAQHRSELLREAERDRLAQAATAASLDRASNPARRPLHEISRQLLARVRHAAHGQTVAPSGTGPA